MTLTSSQFAVTEGNVDGIFYLASFETFNPDKSLLVCLHGNSSCAETFWEVLRQAQLKGIQVVAPDLPGCGRSLRLDAYSMEIVAEKMDVFISSFDATKVFLFGHSLGGHLTSFLKTPIDGIAIAGTPPLSSETDFPVAFKPDVASRELIPLLSKGEPFTHEEASRFVGHTGVQGILFEQMTKFAERTDGKFRLGCLNSITAVNQRIKLEAMVNVVIFHATEDGVINPHYLEQINKTCLFEGKIHYLLSKHMSPVFQPELIVATLQRAFGL